MTMRAMFQKIRSFCRDEDGAALVEFAISLPLILVVAYGMIDSMRLFWSYQATIAGVRDATRYLARVAPADICDAGPGIASFEPLLLSIVDSTIDGEGIAPFGVTITSLSATLDCITTLGLRQPVVPIATVTANLTMEMPFTGVLTLVGGTGWGTLTTAVQDQARVYGL